ncbi:MAG: inositol phosphorylceramide synthase [Deltaproteobacteria bacterium]|nr:inositol phosphorylceramide synthase [Deltaproteobacteria bacterium]
MRRFLPIPLAFIYLSFVQISMGVRLEHLALVLLMIGCYYAHPKSRQFIKDFFPFALFGILYDLLKIIPKEWAGPIHVEWPYHFEKTVFGFNYSGTKITPNEFFQTHTVPVLDILAAITYSLHMVVPLVTGFYFWIQDGPFACRFARAFFAANLLAFVTYVALPVAPPWFIEQHGFIPALWSTPGSAAGLVNFDQLVGGSYFSSLYAKASWVFGAIPSMHAGFPLLVILFAHQYCHTHPADKKFRIVLPFLYLFLVLVWFSAVYLRHHYIIDLLAGALYVWATFELINNKWLNNSKKSFP